MSYRLDARGVAAAALVLVAVAFVGGCAGSPWANATPQERALWLQGVGGSIQQNALPPYTPPPRNSAVGCTVYQGQVTWCP
jgi:hypothetical protein